MSGRRGIPHDDLPSARCFGFFLKRLKKTKVMRAPKSAQPARTATTIMMMIVVGLEEDELAERGRGRWIGI